MKKFNGSSTLEYVLNLYLDEVEDKELNYCHNLNVANPSSVYGNMNASKKYAVNLLLGMTDLPYTRQLGILLRELITHAPEMPEYGYTTIEDGLYNLSVEGYIIV